MLYSTVKFSHLKRTKNFLISSKHIAMFTSNILDDSDLARLLQEEYDREAAVVLDDEDDTRNTELAIFDSRDKKKKLVSSRQSLIPDLSPVDPSLELLDPTPDIILLFLDFNERYFWSSLAGIEVKWSPRMTLCAGLCVYEGRGGLCSVRLSLPLLKLRPRKDLVETLLHEMIHAYLFVTNNDRVYHTFNDEVDSYQQHWWRCNGPCQQRAPYFGYVKRSMNRAPSAKDFWWPEHQATCGGVYTKIREPEGYGQKKSGKGKGKEGAGNVAAPSKDIHSFWGKGHTLSSNTEANIKASGSSLSEGKSKTSSTNTATFNSGVGPRNTTTGQASVTGVLSKPSFDHRNIFAVRNSPTDPSVHGRLSFKQLADKNHKDKYSTSAGNSEAKTSVNSNNASSKSGVGDSHSRSEIHKRFDNSFSSNKTRKNSPHAYNKKVLFPKNFVSVCVGGDSKCPVKRKKKKYIIDDLDSNDGLWDETVDVTADVNFSELSNEWNSIGETGKLGSGDSLENRVMNKLPAGLTNHGSDSTSQGIKNSPRSKPVQGRTQSSNKTDTKINEIRNGNWSVKGKSDDFSFSAGTRPGIDDFGSQASVSENGATKFAGQGYKLGTGESGSSFLSEIRKTWQQKSDSGASTSSRQSSHSSPDSRLFRLSHIDRVNASPSFSNKKRTSVEAFGTQEVNNVDSKKTVKIDEVTSYDHSNTRHTSVNELVNEVNFIEAPQTHVQVACPVCNILVLENTINAHLDLCLLSS